MIAKPTLNDILGSVVRVFPEARYATLDSHVRIFSTKPVFSKDYQEWRNSKNHALAVFSVDIERLNLAQQLGKSGELDFSRCIATTIPDSDDTEIKNHKKVTRSNRCIAWFSDGSTVVFDTMEEACLFFEIRRTSTLRNIIEKGQLLPDGTTAIDYLYEGD